MLSHTRMGVPYKYTHMGHPISVMANIHIWGRTVLTTEGLPNTRQSASIIKVSGRMCSNAFKRRLAFSFTITYFQICSILTYNSFVPITELISLMENFEEIFMKFTASM